MLEKIKLRCGIPEQITVYDSEFQMLIDDCIADMKSAGVPERLIFQYNGETDERVLTAITLYVQALRGSDRTDTDKYLELYHRRVFKLSLEPDEEL